MRAPLTPGTHVLVHNTKRSHSFSDKAQDRWRGPFVVFERLQGGSYRLAGLDGTPLA